MSDKLTKEKVRLCVECCKFQSCLSRKVPSMVNLDKLKAWTLMERIRSEFGCYAPDGCLMVEEGVEINH